MRVLGIYTRLLVNTLDQSLPFYEELLQTRSKNRFRYPEMHLELAQVGNFLLIAGSDEALAPFRDTIATILVDSLSEFKAYLEVHGSKILRGPRQVPTGINMTVRHPDGTVIEYVEHVTTVD